jgi:acyl-ACP thioesterase
MAQGLSRPNTWEDEYLVSFYEVDAKKRILLHSLWKYLQETAWNHANRIGIGYSDLARNDHFWVLSRLSIEMNEYPGWGDKVRVKTWLSGNNRLFAFRDFSIFQKSGRVIGGAKSAWVVLDFNNRKPQRMEPFLEGLNSLQNQHGTESKLDKLPLPAHPGPEVLFTARYSDLDMNQHVNNVRYIEWILDSYPMEINQTHYVTTFEMNFLAESSCGDELSIRSEQQKDPLTTFLHTMVRKEDGRELCRARVQWKRVE